MIQKRDNMKRIVCDQCDYAPPKRKKYFRIKVVDGNICPKVLIRDACSPECICKILKDIASPSSDIKIRTLYVRW